MIPIGGSKWTPTARESYGGLVVVENVKFKSTYQLWRCDYKPVPETGPNVMEPIPGSSVLDTIPSAHGPQP